MSKLVEKAQAMAQARDTRSIKEISKDRVKARRDRARAGSDEPDPRMIYVTRKIAEFAADSANAWDMINGSAWDTRVPDILLATVFYESWTEEYVIFVDYSEMAGGKPIPRLDNASDDFLVESIQEIGQYVADKKLSDTDGDLLIKHLNAEIMKRLDSRSGSE